MHIRNIQNYVLFQVINILLLTKGLSECTCMCCIQASTHMYTVHCSNLHVNVYIHLHVHTSTVLHVCVSVHCTCTWFYMLLHVLIPYIFFHLGTTSCVTQGTSPVGNSPTVSQTLSSTELSLGIVHVHSGASILY